MSKIVSRLLENVTWLQELSGILTVFFIIIFIIVVVRVLRWKKEKVNQYKKMPLDDNGSDDQKS